MIPVIPPPQSPEAFSVLGALCLLFPGMHFFFFLLLSLDFRSESPSQTIVLPHMAIQLLESGLMNTQIFRPGLSGRGGGKRAVRIQLWEG